MCAFDIIRRFIFSHFKLIVIFLIGVLIGRGGRTNHDSGVGGCICGSDVEKTLANNQQGKTNNRIRKASSLSSPAMTTPSSSSEKTHIDPGGYILKLSEIPITNTSHVDDYGKPITKQQLLNPFFVPSVTGFSIATLQPGQRVKSHNHYSMHEFFYILQGSVIFTMKKHINIDGEKQSIQQQQQQKLEDVLVTAGSFIHFPPHATHGLYVPPDSDSMKMLLAGVVIPEDDEKHKVEDIGKTVTG